MKKVSLITVNYNHADITLQLLYSVKKFARYSNIEIIVVDNGSKTDKTEWLRRQYPDAKFIRSEENLGFAGGNNLGIKEASGDYLLFVNNDTEIFEDVITALANVLDNDPTIGVVSPKIVYYDRPEIIQYAGFTAMNYNTGRNKCVGQFEIDKGQYDQHFGPTSYAHGAAMMVRVEAVEKAGPMPENYFLYYEEMDWCEKIRRAGYTIWVETKTQIRHKESLSVGAASPLKEYFMTRNRILFIRRNAPSISVFIFCVYFLFVVTPRNLINYILSRRLDLASSFFKGIWWNLTHKKDSFEL
ncbi:glycosyltransferase family 2 protein [Daejeonella sp.]|uniref:glycosyltransferase family 2 protein n=1 Tax=Daejeonella sp. TaxID=2805397 RepID=UPI0030BFBB54